MVMWLGNNKSVIKSCKLWTLGNWKLEMTNFTTTLFCVSKTIISRRRRYQPLYSPKNLCNLNPYFTWDRCYSIESCKYFNPTCNPPMMRSRKNGTMANRSTRFIGPTKNWSFRGEQASRIWKWVHLLNSDL